MSANNPSILEMRGSKLRFADPSYRLPQFQVTFDGSELQADALPSYVLLIQVTGCRAKFGSLKRTLDPLETVTWIRNT